MEFTLIHIDHKRWPMMESFAFIQRRALKTAITGMLDHDISSAKSYLVSVGREVENILSILLFYEIGYFWDRSGLW